MDKNKIEEARKVRDAERMAMDMMLSMLEAIAPDDMQPMIQLPKLCYAIVHKASSILSLVGDADLESSTKIASEANELLSRVNEALEAFIDQHTEGGMSE